MNAANAKFLQTLAPAAIHTAGAVSTVEIDTLGYSFAEILVSLGATDGALSVLKVGESDTTGGGSGYTDVPGAVFGTSIGSAGVASTLPAATDDNKLYLINLDLKGRKRFLSLQITVDTASTGAYLSAETRLSRGEIAPITAAQMGAAQALRVPAYGT